MNLIIFGASRGVGRAVTELALAKGHRVTAVVRNPSALALDHESLTVAAGDVTDADSVRRCLSGHNMVVCTVGADTRGGTTLYSDAARNIARAMEIEGVPRLLFLSNFGVLGEKGQGVRTATMVFLIKRLLRRTLDDHRRALDELSRHDLQWT
jgi:putative NADH-flavin reductase